MKPVPRKAFLDVSGFEAKKHNVRQTTDGLWQLTLTVAEFGKADWLVFAPVGLPLAIGLKAMDYDNPVEEIREPDPLQKYVTKAGMLCRDEEFQKFMEKVNAEYGEYNWGEGDQEKECANALKKHLGITSRSQLRLEGNDYNQIRIDFNSLVTEFKRSL